MSAEKRCNNCEWAFEVLRRDDGGSAGSDGCNGGVLAMYTVLYRSHGNMAHMRTMVEFERKKAISSVVKGDVTFHIVRVRVVRPCREHGGKSDDDDY